MATIDLSRAATNFGKHFDGARMQQGRVLTDDDFNEHACLGAEDTRRTRLNVIGPAGSPDDGFLIQAPRVSNGNNTFLITAGSFYLGGLRLTLEADEYYHLQKDWLQQGEVATDRIADPAGGVPRIDLVYLEAWQQPVSAVEDNELFEVGLGGPDTSVRVRTMRRVRVHQGSSADCEEALASLLALSDESELVSDARLKMEPDGTTGTSDLCSPPVAGGYLGAENQAIRVQLVSNHEFTWGFDNAAPLYRVQLAADANGTRRRIIMLTEPKDQAHWPLAGQVVELLPWSAALVNNQKLAELHGHLAKVNGTYNPDTKEFFIDTAPPGPGGAPAQPFGEHWRNRNDTSPPNPTPGDASVLDDEGEFFYLRVWNRGSDTASPARIPFVPGTAVSLIHTGLKVTFTGTQFRPDDFWIIAVRPESPTVFVPWDFDPLKPSSGQPPGRRAHGVRRWFAPLAIIRWTPGAPTTGIVVHDCRPRFLPLTRIRGCCTYTVGDGTHSHGHFTRIQAAIEALPPEGGQVCVLAGVYNESVVIDQHVNIRVHGCGPESRVRAVTLNNTTSPAFLISNSTAIVLEDMAIESGPRSAVQIYNSRHVTVRHCLIQMRDLPTLWQAIFSRGDDVLIESNVIEVLPREGGPPAPTLPPAVGTAGAPAGVNTPPDPIVLGSATRGGIQLAGGSDRVSIRANIIRGGIWNGITLGSLRVVGSNDPDDIPDTPPSEDPCDPCAPVDQTDDPPDTPGTVRYESAGDLYDIRISGNRISDMGINGIGVVRFFNLARGGDMIGVHGLHITDNFITRCMRRNLAKVSTAMQFLVAYGGIALAKVTDLRILRNEIVANGTSDLEPICGVFAIFVQALQLDDNRILDNGPKTGEPASNAQNGLRGGVHIWIVLPTIEQAVGSVFSSSIVSTRSIRSGIPTCSMRDNIIVAPLGRAVTFFALGPVVVARNRLMTRGTTGRGLDLIAATVLIGNLGLSNEWTLGLILVLLLRLTGKIPNLTQVDYCGFAKLIGLINPANPPSLWPPFIKQWATGKTLVTENQITLDLMDEPFVGFGISSILIFTLDDLGMTDNQCEISSTNVFFLADAILAGGSLREADNRFAETWLHAFLSSLSLGGMNTTTDNQSTHCMLAWAPLLVFRDNLAFITAFCPNECGGRIIGVNG